ncbi:hypothetical protein LINPERHAP1_LOCUS5798, partial [Linum perenne]
SPLGRRFRYLYLNLIGPADCISFAETIRSVSAKLAFDSRLRRSALQFRSEKSTGFAENVL